MAAVTAKVSLDGIHLNGKQFRERVAPSEYAAILDSPVRIVEPLQPAPYGHRNNQIHLFDELGLYLIEHHSTRLVDSIVFVLWLDEAAFKPAREFDGELTIGGVHHFSGMTEKDLRIGSIPFEGPILGSWIAKEKRIWIGIRGVGIRLPSRARSKRLRIADVSVCFNSN